MKVSCSILGPRKISVDRKINSRRAKDGAVKYGVIVGTQEVDNGRERRTGVKAENSLLTPGVKD